MKLSQLRSNFLVDSLITRFLFRSVGKPKNRGGGGGSKPLFIADLFRQFDYKTNGLDQELLAF